MATFKQVCIAKPTFKTSDSYMAIIVVPMGTPLNLAYCSRSKMRRARSGAT